MSDSTKTVSTALEKLHSEQHLVTKLEVPSADALLLGGFKTGHVYELYGPSGAGKTQLALTLAAQTALSSFRRSSVAYVDTKCDFFAERLAQIVKARADGGKKRSSALEKVHVKKVFDLDDLLATLEGLCEGLRASEKDSKTFFSRLRLLVLDSVASVTLPAMSEAADMREVSRKAARMCGLLSKIALAHNVCVLVTNHATLRTGEDGTAVTRPSLGKFFSSCANTRLFIKREKDAMRVLKVEKSLAHMTRKENAVWECRVGIGAKGVEPVVKKEK